MESRRPHDKNACLVVDCKFKATPSLSFYAHHQECHARGSIIFLLSDCQLRILKQSKSNHLRKSKKHLENVQKAAQLAELVETLGT